MKRYKALTIAGSDSGAGAALQADLKTFAALGVYGTSVVTAITTEKTTGVTWVLEIPEPMVAAQLDTVMNDIGADAVKPACSPTPVSSARRPTRFRSTASNAWWWTR